MLQMHQIRSLRVRLIHVKCQIIKLFYSRGLSIIRCSVISCPDQSCALFEFFRIREIYPYNKFLFNNGEEMIIRDFINNKIFLMEQINNWTVDNVQTRQAQNVMK